MRAFHDSRNNVYRTPYGAVAPGTSITLAIDVFDLPDAAVMLRTWTDAEGERLYAMRACEAAQGSHGVRYQVELEPEAAGVVWYHFVIADEHGNTKRYGALPGRVGGVGQLYEWEPPSFQLTVHTTRDMPPAWHEMAGSCINNNDTVLTLEEIVETVRENFPTAQYRSAYPWTEEGADAVPAWSPWPALASLTNLADQSAATNDSAVADEPASRTDADSTDDETSLAGHVEAAAATPIADRVFAVNDEVFGFWSHDDAGNVLCTLVNTSPRQFHDVPVPLIADEVSELVGGYGVHIVGAEELKALRLSDSFHFVETYCNGQAASETTDSSVNANASVTRQASSDADGDGRADDNAGESRHDHASDKDCTDPAESGRADDHGTSDNPHAPAGLTPAGASRFAHARLHPLGACVLHFHATDRLQRPLQKGVGVLAHITSVPADGVGTLGAPALEFVDQLAEAGVRYWQVLPANPTDEFGSPYAGISAFAGNVRFLENAGSGSTDPARLPRAKAKIAKLKKYRQFCEREQHWLEPFAAFMALRQKLGENLMWQEWPKRYRHYDPAIIAADDELSASAEAWRQAQYLFEEQWSALHAHAREKGVLIVGDMPIYVSTDSADVWAHQDIFQLGKDGLPACVAGCAPDAFAADGQVWGNPLYDWDACKAEDYTWWLRRLKRAFELYDVVRLDHFIGFSRYYSIPAGQKASAGTYLPGPGVELFQRAYEQLGPLPVIAEDLGLITPAVRDLSASCGFPGMDIAQFVDGNDPLSGYWPRPDKIAYTGTHDNQTLAGYCEQRYPHLNAREAAADIMVKVATCSADVCIMPLQDLMGLDDEARMNVPGVADGNWTWQAKAADMPAAMEEARKLVALHDKRG